MQNGPKPLNRIEVGAVGRQLDQVDTTSCPGEEGSDIRPFVVGSVVPNDMNNALVEVARFDLGQKLGGTDPINGCGFDKGCVEACLILNAALGVLGSHCPPLHLWRAVAAVGSQAAGS